MTRIASSEPDPMVVVSARVRRSTLERVAAAARVRDVPTTTMLRLLLDRASRRKPRARRA